MHLRDIYFVGMHLMGAYFMGVYLMGMHLMGMHLMGMHLKGVQSQEPVPMILLAQFSEQNQALRASPTPGVR
jgi:hypothetical protein